MRTRVEKLAFNRGLVSRLGLARADIKRLAMAAEIQTNWIPRVLGSMSIRPGWKHLGESASNNRAFHIPFIFSVTEKALIEITNLLMRVWVDDALVTRFAVASGVVNGNFDIDLASWTDNDEAGGTSAFVTGGYMGLTGNGTAAAIRDQTVGVAVADQGVEHALRIVIERGPVVLRVGSTAGGDEYVAETELATGAHSLAFTPTGNFNIRFLSRVKRQVLVNSCNVEAAGVMTLPAPWVTANLGRLRYDQSGDVLFVACAKTTDKIGYQERRIERRGTRSWSLVGYYANDGPFLAFNAGPITMTPGALSGNTTLTASASYFKSTHAPSTDNAGALFRVESSGQRVTASVTAANQFTSAIRVIGVGASRPFTVIRSGIWVATVTLQRSLESDAGPWADVTTYTTNGTVSFDDGLDNQIAWYRIGVKTAEFTSGTVELELNYSAGSILGVCRVTSFTSATVVNVEVITDFGATTATTGWAEGRWSDRRGWPTAVAFHEGRLTWEGRDAIDASISDAFDSFDDEFEGDAGPIGRTIGSGPVDNINWALSLQRLVLGAEMTEFSVRASSLDEILTPTNFNIKAASGQGSAPVAAIKIDQNGAFVQRGGTRVFELAFGSDGVDYEANHLSALVPEIGQPRIERLLLQRQPDTRVHCIRSDGTVAMLVFDKLEQVICWIELETTGLIEDAVVLPGDPGEEEDHVYYSVARTINGATKRFLEKWAFESECRGDEELCKLADSFVTYTGAATVTIPVAHLEKKDVAVWADGADIGTEDPHLALSGTASNFMSTPDSAELSITADIDIRLRIALPDWTPADEKNLFAKDDAASARDWQFTVLPAGTLRFYWWDSGGTLRFVTSSVATGTADEASTYIRVTLDVDDDAGGHEAKFWTSSDGEIWTQLGSTQNAGAFTTSIRDTAGPLIIGGSNVPSIVAGRIYEAQVRNGIAGEIVAHFLPTVDDVGETTIMGGDTDETWTIQGSEPAITEQRFRVTSGAITLDAAASNVVVGLPYEAPWKSAKLVELMNQLGGSITDTQIIKAIALVLADVHAKGLKYGRSLTESEMHDMPERVDGSVVDADAVRADYTMEPMAIAGEWTQDERICLLAKAPRPCTVLAALAEVEHHG